MDAPFQATTPTILEQGKKTTTTTPTTKMDVSFQATTPTQGRFTIWARWALAQGPAPSGAPHLLGEKWGGGKKKKRKKERNRGRKRKKKYYCP